MNDIITCAQLDAMSDEEFIALFPGGAAWASFVLSLAIEDEKESA